MNKNNLPYYETGYFTKAICDYIAQKEQLGSFYDNYPNIDGFKKQIKLKQLSFQQQSRNLLVEVLENQYQNIKISKSTGLNIQQLLDENTFTITTGHQLNLFTGPLYFLYKIFSAINLCEQLKKEFSQYNFVPIYWMATEDHDFEEINFFNFKKKKISWDRRSSGAVGRLSTDGLNEVYDLFKKELGNSNNAHFLANLFKEAYLNHDNLTDATRFLANELFKEFGLVIIDGDDKKLKKQFIPFMENELINQNCFNKVSETNSELEKNYKIQVNPREINLFYLTDDNRDRIILKNGAYTTIDNQFTRSKDQIIDHLYKKPERFSPNVIMRPLYEEVILPNLCYIGGGGELAYWLELKNYFDSEKIPFPILLLRNSALLISKAQSRKLEKLDISYKEIFLKQHVLINKKVREVSDIKIDFTEQRSFLIKQFIELEKLAKLTDKSFIGAVKAQQAKQLKGLDNLEKRLLKAQKRKLSTLVDRITDLQNELFPNQSLEERILNFSELYIEYGEGFIQRLKSDLDPLNGEFQIIQL